MLFQEVTVDASRQPSDQSTVLSHAGLSLRTSGQDDSLGDLVVIGNSLRLLSTVSGFWYFGDGCLVKSSTTGGGRSIVKVRMPRCATSLPHSASSSEGYMIMHGAWLCGPSTQREPRQLEELRSLRRSRGTMVRLGHGRHHNLQHLQGESGLRISE